MGAECSIDLQEDIEVVTFGYKDQKAENRIATFNIKKKKIVDGGDNTCKDIGMQDKLHKACICSQSVKVPDSKCQLDRKFKLINMY